MKPQQMVSAWTWLAGEMDGAVCGMVATNEGSSISQPKRVYSGINGKVFPKYPSPRARLSGSLGLSYVGGRFD